MSSLVRGSERCWLAAPQEDVEICILHSAENGREAAALIRMGAGAKLPLHDHPGGEHVYVLEGSVYVDGLRVEAGDYLHTPIGGVHEIVADELCILFSVLPKGGSTDSC